MDATQDTGFANALAEYAASWTGEADTVALFAALLDDDADPFRRERLAGHFTAIHQAMAVPREKTAGAAYVREFVERCKANGLVQQALQRSGQGDVTLAPSA